MNAIIALVTGKLIALYIIPEDFGTYNLQWAAYTFFTTLILSPLLQFVKSSNNTILPKIGTKYFGYTALALLVIAFILLSWFMYAYDPTTEASIFLIFLLFIPLAFVNSILGDYFQTRNMLITYSKFSILIGSFGLLFLAGYFVNKLGFLSAQEVLWSMRIIGVVGASLMFISRYKIYKTKIPIAYRTFLKKYFRFAWPLIFLAIWAWINNYFDRYAIDYFLTTKEVGIYNASYSVGSKFFLLVSPIYMILLTPRVYALQKKEVKKREVKKFGLFYFLLAIPLLVAIYIFRDVIGNILLSENYSAGFFIIFWIALAYFLLTSTQLFELIFYAEQKTKIILYASICSALTNITLNILLIPELGIFGAAIATCCAFVFHFCIIFLVFRKI